MSRRTVNAYPANRPTQPEPATDGASVRRASCIQCHAPMREFTASAGNSVYTAWCCSQGGCSSPPTRWTLLEGVGQSDGPSASGGAGDGAGMVAAVLEDVT